MVAAKSNNTVFKINTKLYWLFLSVYNLICGYFQFNLTQFDQFGCKQDFPFFQLVVLTFNWEVQKGPSRLYYLRKGWSALYTVKININYLTNSQINLLTFKALHS